MKKKKKNAAAVKLGSKGGFSTKQKYGNGHYSEIGKKGRASRPLPEPHDCQRDQDCTHSE